MGDKFIMTTDSEVAEELKKLGYVFVNQTKNAYLFVNDITKTNNNKQLFFDKAITFTDKLWV